MPSYVRPGIRKCAKNRALSTEGTDYSQFRQESKKTIAAAASTAASIKAVLDTPLLAEDGSLTLESEKLMKNSGI